MTGLCHLVKPHLPILFSKKRQRIGTRSSLVSLRDIDGPLPIVLNSPEDANDSLISGRLLLDVNHGAIEVKDLTITLHVNITHKKPFKKGCKACQHYTLESKSYHNLTTSTVLQHGSHEFPFVFEIGSHLPPSTNNALVAVTYELHVDACIHPTGQPQTVPQIYSYKRELPVARMISVPISPTHSRRVFNATGIETVCQYNPVINLAGANKASLTLSGLVVYPENGDSIHVWKLLKGSWWLEENAKTMATACGHHSHMLSEKIDQNRRDRSTTKLLGEGGIDDGWDQTANNDSIDLGLEYCIKKSKKSSSSHSLELSGVGEMALSVSHCHVVELFLIKEYYPKDGSGSPTRTGVARILRSKHDVFLSDHTKPAIIHQEEDLPCYDERALGPPDYNG